jgi:hypothetical protein
MKGEAYYTRIPRHHGLCHSCASLAISAGANGHLMADDLAGVATALGDAIKATQTAGE